MMKLLLKVVGQSVDEMMLMVMICESDWSEWYPHINASLATTAFYR